jgi:hypothetical protein
LLDQLMLLLDDVTHDFADREHAEQGRRLEDG